MKKVLCIHGIGGKDASMDEWSVRWKAAIVKSCNHKEDEFQFDFLPIDDIFSKYQEKNGIKYTKTIAKLIRDWISTALFRDAREIGFKEKIRWYAGMVVQFVEDEEMRKELHNRLSKKIKEFNPDIIYSHSLGTLISYDFLRQETVTKNQIPLVLITSGSQLGHPALLRTFGGKIQPLSILHWYNLHNQYDKVFAYEPIDIDDASFTEIETPFSDGFLNSNHEALDYISDENAIKEVWSSLFDNYWTKSKRNLKFEQINITKKRASSIKKLDPSQKALLVGINDYPDPENQLNGCLNDVFRMSEVLQEAGIKPENIKVVLNERATSDNLRLTMDWLLKDAKNGDFRFFYYSGHGAQIPSDGIIGDSDHLDECLVTYDFDWSRQHSYTDKEFLKSYSQLAYGVDFITILDCCHSGGMTRDGLFKARGVNPPDDIRHRIIKWDAGSKMWIPRELELAKRHLFDKTTIEDEKEKYVGKSRNVQKFGRAISLWLDSKEYKTTKQKYGTLGPYMPLIIEACKENEYSYEYKHGVSSFGAFTYCFTTILRELNERKVNKKISYKTLVDLVAQRLKDFGYSQTPQIIGPDSKINKAVPMLAL